MALTDSGTRQLGAEMAFFGYTEASWGQTPGSPDYVHLPLETPGAALAKDRRTNQVYYGNGPRKFGRHFKPRTEGTLGGALYGDYVTEGSDSISKAQWIMSKGISATSGVDLPSFGLLRQEPISDAGKRFPGCKINQFTLQGSADAGRIEWNASIIGLVETLFANNTYRTIPDDLKRLVEFEYADSTFTVDGNAFCWESFVLTCNNGLKPRYGNCNAGPTSMNRTSWDKTLNFRIEKKNNAWDVARRTLTAETEFPVVIVIKGKHSGTGGSGTNYAKATITMPRCQLLNPPDSDTFDDVSVIDVATDVLKPDSSSAQITVAWTEE